MLIHMLIHLQPVLEPFPRAPPPPPFPETASAHLHGRAVVAVRIESPGMRPPRSHTWWFWLDHRRVFKIFFPPPPARPGMFALVGVGPRRARQTAERHSVYEDGGKLVPRGLDRQPLRRPRHALLTPSPSFWMNNNKNFEPRRWRVVLCLPWRRGNGDAVWQYAVSVADADATVGWGAKVEAREPETCL